jgi:sulfur-oxidizing protein SoxX
MKGADIAHRGHIVGCTLAASIGLAAQYGYAQPAVAPFEVTGDAIAMPLASRSGNAERGRSIVLDRETGNCLICHKVPIPTERFQGEVGPDLTGIGSRLSAGQIRLRVVDARRLNPVTVMPPYHRIAGTVRVAERWRGRPVLDAQQVEDVVAWLATLKE